MVFIQMTHDSIDMGLGMNPILRVNFALLFFVILKKTIKVVQFD